MTLNLLSSFKGQIPWNAIITLRDNITMRWCFAGKWTNIGRILGGKEHIIVNIAHKRILQAKKNTLENVTFPPAEMQILSLMLMWQFPHTLLSCPSHSSANTSACLLSNSCLRQCRITSTVLFQFLEAPCSGNLPHFLRNSCLALEAEEIFPIWTVKLSFPI